MTVFHCDGFETYGVNATAGATVQANINATDKAAFTLVTSGHVGDVTLIDDFEVVGLAMEFPDVDAASGEYVTYEWPDGSGRFPDYKVATNASHPVMVTGFRIYNPASMTPTQIITIWACLTGATTVASQLHIAANGVDLIFDPASGSSTTITGAITKGAWHYIEIEFLFAPSANSGYAKIFVDGVEVHDQADTISTFTFFSGYGVRVGAGAVSNQTAGENFAIDDVYQMEIDGVEHTDVLGPCRVLLLSPSSDDTPNDWSPSSGGDNFALIDEQNWVTGDYVEAATTADDDHYGLSTLSADAVHGLQIDVVCEATDGTPNLHIGFDDGTADEEDMGTIATGGAVQKRMMFEIDPSGSAWDVAAANAAEASQRMTE